MSDQPQEINLKQDSLRVLTAHTELMTLHYRTMACHCECMGMMSENMFSAMLGTAPLYNNASFKETMKRWKLVDDKGECII